MKSGVITQADIKAKCPYCEEETDIFVEELLEEIGECQHCGENFILENAQF